MKKRFAFSLCAVAVCTILAQARAQEAVDVARTLDAIVVKGKRDNRISKGATGLAMEIAETPQSISTVEKEDIRNYALGDSNEALRLATGVNVEQYETNRAVFNSRGFDVQLTQIDGLGMSNDWGVVLSQQDTWLFERIELIRGANGLLTGVGNASGTVNYVRKRPLNRDEGEVGVLFGSHGRKRGVFDYNKVLSADGRWAGRLLMAHEDKDSWIRALHNRRSNVYAVVDGQIGEMGVLTAGLSWQRHLQDSPMWGSLTLNYAPPQGGMAEFDVSASTSQDWTYWNTRSFNAFAEYVHHLGDNWELKVTGNHRKTDEDAALFYAFAPQKGLSADNTGLLGWPHASNGQIRNRLLDVNMQGIWTAFGREHELIFGLSHSVQENSGKTREYDTVRYQFKPLPAFPYAGNAYPEPLWGAWVPRNGGKQALTRLYAANRFALGDNWKAIIGVNAVKLHREGSSRYGGGTTVTHYPDTREVSPYVGLTWEFAPGLTGYVSWSDIFQNQDQSDYYGVYLDPMRGVNKEVGVKAEWLDGRMLTTVALFTAEQQGLATEAEGLNPQGQSYYEPKDVESRGVEIESSGRLGESARLSLGITHLKLTGPDRLNIYEWVPRNTVKLRLDSRLPGVPQLQLGAGLRWQSHTQKNNGAWQGAYTVAHAFAAYEFSKQARVQLNVDNVFNEKYVEGLVYGAIYGMPRSTSLSFNYRF
ncbi:TonB-dependent siderophore receptor [Lysobacteraceae bacterium NML07-0707]|nr:TonB-dependent siderophore receptor [Xanthomonadaceae bacterium NML07-0707]